MVRPETSEGRSRSVKKQREDFFLEIFAIFFYLYGMNLAAIHAQQQIPSPKNVKVLQNGSSVLVRVIADKGGGQYEGSVAGVRVNLRSQNPLKPGDFFTATVNLKNGKIEVSPKTESGITFTSGKLIFENAGAAHLENLLNSLGLPADEINKHLAMQFKQLEMKFDASLLRKLRGLSVRFNGKEKSAGEIASILRQKGIEPDGELITALLSLFYDDQAGEDSTDKKKDQILKIINHKYGWIFLPYEIVRAENEVLGSGVIRLLLDSANQLKKANFNARLNQKEYIFNLDFEKKHLSKLMANISPEPSEAEKEEFISALQKKLLPFGKPETSWAEKEDVEGTGCEAEELLMVGGMV